MADKMGYGSDMEGPYSPNYEQFKKRRQERMDDRIMSKVPYPEHMGTQQDSANHPANNNESSNLKPEQEMR